MEMVERYAFNVGTADEKRYSIMESEGRKLFIIEAENPYLTKEEIAPVIEYTKGDNRIVETYEMGKRIVTKFMEGYSPLVPSISDPTFEDMERRGERYRSLIQDWRWVLWFYDRVEREFSKFYEATRCHFSDVSANNILVNDRFDDFVIVDMQSVYKEKNGKPLVPGSKVILPNAYPEGDHVMRKYTGLSTIEYKLLGGYFDILTERFK